MRAKVLLVAANENLISRIKERLLLRGSQIRQIETLYNDRKPFRVEGYQFKSIFVDNAAFVDNEIINYVHSQQTQYNNSLMITTPAPVEYLLQEDGSVLCNNEFKNLWDYGFGYEKLHFGLNDLKTCNFHLRDKDNHPVNCFNREYEAQFTCEYKEE